MQDNKESIVLLKQIRSRINAAAVLYEHGYYRESIKLLEGVLQTFNNFIDESRTLADFSLAEVTRLFIERYSSAKFWKYTSQKNIAALTNLLRDSGWNNKHFSNYEICLRQSEEMLSRALSHYQKFLCNTREKKHRMLIKGIVIGGLVMISGYAGFFMGSIIRSDISYTKKNYSIEENLRYLANSRLTKNTEAHIETFAGPVVKAKKIASDAWIIGNRWWYNIYKTVRAVNGVKRKCIWMHPVPFGKKVLVFKGVALGKSLVIFYGMADGCYSARSAAVKLEVDIGNGRITKMFVQESKREDWNRVEINTAGFAGEKIDILFRVFSSNSDRRWFCFAPYVKENEGYEK